MKYIIKEEKLESLIKLYINNLYNDLTCKINPDEVIWYRDGSPVAKISKENTTYLRLKKNDFYGLLNTFSLEWDEETDLKLRKLIIPYLKFDGGSEAIPILIDLGFITQITNIALPSNL
jgi:hypothetical protein